MKRIHADQKVRLKFLIRRHPSNPRHPRSMAELGGVLDLGGGGQFADVSFPGDMAVFLLRMDVSEGQDRLTRQMRTVGQFTKSRSSRCARLSGASAY